MYISLTNCNCSHIAIKLKLPEKRTHSGRHILLPLQIIPAQCEDGVIRLVEGVTDREGRLEVCLGQRWGTICDYVFHVVDAQTVCKQLGYSATGIESHF